MGRFYEDFIPGTAFAGFGVLAVTAAIAGWIEPVPKHQPTADIHIQSNRLHCVGKHTLRITMPDSIAQDVPVAHCDERPLFTFNK